MDLLGARKAKVRVLHCHEDDTCDEKYYDLDGFNIVLKKNDEVIKKWGHSPKLMLPRQGTRDLVQIINDREVDPCDPFGLLTDKERYTEVNIQRTADEAHERAISKKPKQTMERVSLILSLCAAGEFFVALFILLMKHYGA